jgi:hypothetical protein
MLNLSDIEERQARVCECDGDGAELLALLRLTRAALWESRAFVVQYGTEREVQHIDDILGQAVEGESDDQLAGKA